MPNRSAITRRLEAKTSSSVVGTFTPANPSLYFAWSGNRFDYARATGSIGANSVVCVGLAWLRQNVCQGRFVVGNEAGGKYEEEVGHPLTAMKRPNPFETWADLWGGITDDTILFGNGFWLKGRDGYDEVREYHWAPNYTIEVVDETDPARARATGPIRGYWFTSGAVREWREPRDVVHFRGNRRDPFRKWMGLSDLFAQDRNAASVTAAERYEVSVLLNAHAGKVLAPKNSADEVDWSEPAALALVESVEKGISGNNAGRLTKSNFAVEMIDAGYGPEAMTLDRIRNMPVAMLLAAMQINGMTLDLPTSDPTSTYANKGVAVRSAYNSGVIPRQERFADTVAATLIEDFPAHKADVAWWDRSAVEALKEDANERANRAVMLRSGGLTSVNESRDIADLAEIPGGDLTPVEEQAGRDAKAAEIAGRVADAQQGQPGDGQGDPATPGDVTPGDGQADNPTS